MNRRSRQQSLRDLLWEWDPLGENDPTDPHVPSDEYDWLVLGVERELDEGADAARLASYLARAVRARYGVDDVPPLDDVASRMASL